MRLDLVVCQDGLELFRVELEADLVALVRGEELLEVVSIERDRERVSLDLGVGPSGAGNVEHELGVLARVEGAQDLAAREGCHQLPSVESAGVDELQPFQVRHDAPLVRVAYRPQDGLRASDLPTGERRKLGGGLTHPEREVTRSKGRR